MFDEIAVLTAPLQYLIADRGSKAYEQNMGPWLRSGPAVATGLELVEEVEAHQRRWRFTIARAIATTCQLLQLDIGMSALAITLWQISPVCFFF